MDLFSKLTKIQSFKFKAIAGEKSLTNWNGIGHGKVIVEVKGNKLFFKEKGYLKLDGNEKKTKIFNEYIWTKLSDNKICLSHSRFGYNNAVILFELEPINIICWISTEPHVCGKDLYSAKLEIIDNSINLKWSIVGPKKDELIVYQYI